MSRFQSLALLGAAVLVLAGFTAFGVKSAPTVGAFGIPATPDYTYPTARKYGSAVSVGEGTARSYVNFDFFSGAPVEIGVALSERALEGLPTSGSGHHGAGMMTHEYLIELPSNNGTPFKFLEMNWNPMGHEPDGVYQDVPHFDFHFYTISKDERDAIVPSDPEFAKRANNLPPKEFIPPYVAQLGPPGASPAQVAVPKMGVHWVDVRSAELQGLLGKPEAYKPFTATFIHGSWNGQVHFWEPMITRAHILAKKSTDDAAVRDEIIPIPTPASYQVPGYYPRAYRILWDAAAQEYRISLTQLAKR